MFDVFLSHSSRDNAAVGALARRLRAEAGLEPFLDRWHLVPGAPWQPAVERALEESRSAAVFIGPSGLSPWHNEEMRAALSLAARTRDEYRVIPVLLPGAEESAITGFLAQRTWVDFRAGLDQEEAFERLVMGIKGVPRPADFTLPDEPAPYRGLYKFEREHADRYFGREAEIADVLARLQRLSFVAVVGASGIGKSSLVLAGVLPRLERRAPGSASLHSMVFTPGPNPLRAMADAVATLLPVGERLKGADELLVRMLERPDGLRTALSTWVADRPGPLLLVIDQLEELFTLAEERGGPERLRAFATNLRDAALHGQGQFQVLATLRADFLDHCLALEPLRDLLQDRVQLLGQMTAEGMRDAIVRPASSVGAIFETGVVSALMKELERQSGALPLLEHALDRLWRQRAGVWLTAAAYEAMGGLSGALRKHADEVFQSLSIEDQAAARDILLRLVAPGEDAPDTKRRVVRDELYAIGASHEQVDRIVQVLAGREARLLVAGAGPDARNPTVEVAHEILIREWPTLRAWVNGARRRLRVQRRLTEAAHEWRKQGRSPEDLLTGARLLQAEEVFGEDLTGLNELEVELLTASLRARDLDLQAKQERHRRELEDARRLLDAQRARARVLRGSAIAIAIIAIFAAVLAVVARREQNLARSRELAGAAIQMLQRDPQAALLLTQEAYRSAHTELVDDALHQYNAQAGRVTLLGHEAWVKAVAFSPDGRWVATGSDDGTARVWDRASGQERCKMRHEDAVNDVAFSADGERLVTASEDQSARVWRTSDCRQLSRVGGTPPAVLSAAFSADGKWIATTASKVVHVYDWAAGTEVATFRKHMGWVASAAFSPVDGSVVSTSLEGMARIWNPATGEQSAQFKGDSSLWMRTAAFSADGRLVVTGEDSGAVRIWNVATGEEKKVIPKAHSGPVRKVSFDVQNRWVLSSGDDGWARLWDLASGSPLASLDAHSGALHGAAISRDGQWLATAGQNGTTRIWAVSSLLQPLRLGNAPYAARTASFSPDGQRIVTASLDGVARIWSAERREPLAILDGGSSSLLEATMGPNADHVLTSSVEREVRTWDVASRQPIAAFDTGGGVIHLVSHSRDGRRIVTVTEPGTPKIWNVSTGQVVATLACDSATIRGVAFSKDGTKVITAGVDGAAIIWDAGTGDELTRFPGSAGPLNTAELDPSGQRLVTAAEDGTGVIWDVATRTIAARLESRHGWTWSASFSPDGQTIVTAGHDGAVRLWDAASGRAVATLAAVGAGTMTASFSPDGEYLLSTGRDGFARLWHSELWKPAGEELLRLEAGRTFSCEERRRFLHEPNCTAPPERREAPH